MGLRRFVDSAYLPVSFGIGAMLPVLSQAATDFSTITDAVSDVGVNTGIVSIGAAIMAIVVVVFGVSVLISMVRRR